MSISKILFIFWRSIFGFCLILLCIRGINDINNNKGFITQNARLYSNKFFNNYDSLNVLGKNSNLILLIENVLLGLTGIFTVFGLGMRKIFIIISVGIELILVHNILFYNESKFVNIASQYLAIMGGVLLN
jgi:hypothetical protein